MLLELKQLRISSSFAHCFDNTKNSCLFSVLQINESVNITIVVTKAKPTKNCRMYEA